MPPDGGGQPGVTAPPVEPGFAGVVGHRDVIARLRAALARDRLAGSYLLAGEDGIGKRTVAEAWMRAIQCRTPVGSPSEIDGCGACASCRHHRSGAHPDVVCLAPQDSTVVTVDQIREMQAALPYPPLEGARRVVLVPDALRLNPGASNALLKVLEEPPPHALFLLLAAQRERLLPTILSRCQVIRCAPPGHEAVMDHLIRVRGLSPEQARRLFIHAQGRIGPALTAIDAEPGDDSGFETIGAPATIGEIARVMDVAERVGKDQQALRALLAWVMLWLRDVLAWQATGESRHLLHPDRREDLAWWADRLSPEDLFDLGAGLQRVWASLHRNLNPQLVAEVVLLQLSIRVKAPRVRRRERS